MPPSDSAQQRPAWLIAAIPALDAETLDPKGDRPGRLEARRFARMDHFSQLCSAAGGKLLDLLERSGELNATTAKIGLFVGSAYGAHQANEQFFASVKTPSPRLFPYTLPSSAGAELAIAYRIKGPTLTYAHGDGAGLQALAHAASLIADSQLEIAIIIGADVWSPTLHQTAPSVARAAAVALALRSTPSEPTVCVGDSFQASGEQALSRAAAYWAKVAPHAESIVVSPEQRDLLGATEGLARASRCQPTAAGITVSVLGPGPTVDSVLLIGG
ncbi:MAG: hypothetical protein H6707_05090 [Deltaproteobacteria bacterium]|nr:hypothetical protein [Deltaproteobacteria bacterium]